MLVDPSDNWVVFVESKTVTVSLPGPPSFRRSTTFVDAPFQPARMVAGSMASLNVHVIVSPSSAFPLVPPTLLVVWMSEPVGAVLSMVNVVDATVLTVPIPSVALARIV